MRYQQKGWDTVSEDMKKVETPSTGLLRAVGRRKTHKL
jgi:hypothetical protein